VSTYELLAYLLYTYMVSFDTTKIIYLLLTNQKSVLQLKFTKSL